MVRRHGPALAPEPPAQFCETWNVSRESLDRLQTYANELVRWQATHNLIAASTLDEIWQRHIADALQLAPYLTDCKSNILDMGSGGGLPAIPLAIALQASGNGPQVTMVESNAKKCAFLRSASIACRIDARIINKRVESLVDSDLKRPVDAIICRALASVTELLEMTEHLPFRPQRMLFLKGQHVDAELTEATKCWNISFSKHPSQTSSDGCILEIHEAERDNRHAAPADIGQSPNSGRR